MNKKRKRDHAANDNCEKDSAENKKRKRDDAAKETGTIDDIMETVSEVQKHDSLLIHEKVWELLTFIFQHLLSINVRK